MKRSEFLDKIMILLSECKLTPDEVLSALSDSYLITCAYYKVPLVNFEAANALLYRNYKLLLEKGIK